MSLLENARIQCPYCWEWIEVVVDCSVDDQQYIEDCEVCCRPITLHIQIDSDGLPQVQAARDEDV